jgi:S1-C subfamily serine protease
MKRLVKIAAIILVLSVIPVGAATYQVTTANYPILVNDQKVNVQPYNLNGSTLLPIRALSDALGVPIEWDNRARTVEIQTVDVDRLKEASVMIYADDGKTQVQGSAVFIDYDQALTAYHVVDENRSNVKTAAGDPLAIENFDSTLDIATLDSTKEIKPVKIGDSDEVKTGDKVIVVGAPGYKEDTVAFGTASKPDPRGMVILTSGLSAQTGGVSGGAVFDVKGNLIGILVAEDEDNAGRFLVIPINDIRKTF